MNQNSVFVDTNFFVALFHEQDSLHKAALEIAGTLERSSNPLVISDLIFLETVTVLSYKKGRKVAIEAGTYLHAHPKILLLHLDEKAHDETWKLFQTIKKKGVSFVDCSSIVAMRDEGIRQLVSFDKTDFQPLQSHYRFHLYKRK